MVLCGLVRGNVPYNARDTPNPRRARTLSLFGNSNHHSKGLVQKMVEFTTWTSPHHSWTKHQRRSRSFGSHAGKLVNFHISTEMRAVFDALYQRLCGHNGSLSREALEQFLTGTQCEQSVKLDKDDYSPGEFLYVLLKDHSPEAIASLPPKDLSKPMSNYFINSSHNTYLDGNQLASRSSAKQYKTALARGCRCIEIDVWNGDEGVPTQGSRSPLAEHSRGISGSSLPNVAGSFRESVEGTVGAAKTYLGGKAAYRSHSQSPSMASQAIFSNASHASSVVGGLGLGGPTSNPEGIRPNRQRGRSHLPKGEPVVTHGWTLASICGFRDVCEAVKEKAFVDNELPIIVSLEVHADLDQQQAMVNIMKEVWGELLLQKPLDGFDSQSHEPTLGDLRRKILIKVRGGKPPAPLSNSVSCPDPILSPELEAESSDNDEGDSLLVTKSSPAASNTGDSEEAEVKVPICSSLADLAIYTRSAKFKQFEHPDSKLRHHIFSVSEDRILELAAKHPLELFTHNKNFFMRAYPAGIRRILSTNPDPSLYWRKGVQMVALNWQMLDAGMMLNEGMFANEQGWVLKPSGYLSRDTRAQTQEEAAPGTEMNLSITIFAGQHIPVPSGDGHDKSWSKSAMRPSVKVELHVERGFGPAKDGQIPDSSYKQKTEANKSDHPMFGLRGTALHFTKIPHVVPELSFVRFKVEDTGIVSSPLLAWSCVRLDRLRPGYRLLKLIDSKTDSEGMPMSGGTLLIKVEKHLK